MNVSKGNIGCLCIFTAGLIPFFVGLEIYIHFLKDFYTGECQICLEIPASWLSKVRTSEHVMAVNLMNTGAFTSLSAILIYFHKSKTVWLFLLCSLIWVGGNDLFAVVMQLLDNGELQFPMPLLPILLGSVGLSLTFRTVFTPLA